MRFNANPEWECSLLGNVKSATAASRSTALQVNVS